MTQQTTIQTMTQQQIELLSDVANAANILDVEQVLISKTRIAGIDTNSTIFVFNNDHIYNIPELGIGRIAVLNSRLKLMQKTPDFGITYETMADQAGDFIKQLTLRNKTTKLDFRCARPSMIKGPQSIKDPEMFSVRLNEDDLSFINKCKSAIASEKITFEVTANKKFKISLCDSNNDHLDYECDTGLTQIDTNANLSNFKRSYAYDKFNSVVSSDADIVFGNKGLLRTTIKNIAVYMMPRID